MSYMKFIKDQEVERIVDGERGIVQGAFQFPDEPWRYAVEFGGEIKPYNADEIREVEG